MINKNIPSNWVYSKKQTRVMANQHIFKSGLNYILTLQQKRDVLLQLQHAGNQGPKQTRLTESSLTTMNSENQFV